MKQWAYIFLGLSNFGSHRVMNINHIIQLNVVRNGESENIIMGTACSVVFFDSIQMRYWIENWLADYTRAITSRTQQTPIHNRLDLHIVRQQKTGKRFTIGLCCQLSTRNAGICTDWICGVLLPWFNKLSTSGRVEEQSLQVHWITSLWVVCIWCFIRIHDV